MGFAVHAAGLCVARAHMRLTAVGVPVRVGAFPGLHSGGLAGVEKGPPLVELVPQVAGGGDDQLPQFFRVGGVEQGEADAGVLPAGRDHG